MALATVLSYTPSTKTILLSGLIPIENITSIVNVSKGRDIYVVGQNIITGNPDLNSNTTSLLVDYDNTDEESTDNLAVRYNKTFSIIWNGSIDSIELTETNGLIDTYTIWGDADKTINLGTFEVENGSKSNYDLAVEEGYAGTALDWVNLSLTEFIRFDLTDEFTPVVPEAAIYVLIIPYDCTFQNLKIYLNEAPLGASFLVDIKVNDVSALVSPLTIVSGELESVDAQLVDPELLADTRLQFDVIQVGVTSKGAGLKFSGEAIKKWL